MDAKEARNTAEKVRKDLSAKHNQEAQAKIKDAANSGKFECTLGFVLDGDVQELLKKQGYKVDIVNDFREGDFTKISW